MKESAENTDVADPAPPPTNVIAAIARVMAEVGGIKKLNARQREQMGIGGGDTGITYAYRGIDQLAQAAQPLFGKYGVVIVPNVLDCQVVKILKGSGAGSNIDTTPWTRAHLEVEWSVYGPGGADDKITSITLGLADDNSDKAYNKAMTTAFKNLLLRILCIGDPQDDTDGHGGGADDAAGEPIDPKGEPPPLGAEVFAEIKALDDDRLKVLLRQKAVDEGKSLAQKALVEDPEWAQLVRDSIAGYQEAKAQDAAAEAPQDRVEGGGEPAEAPGEGSSASDPPPSAEPDRVKPGSAAKRGPRNDGATETTDLTGEKNA